MPNQKRYQGIKLVNMKKGKQITQLDNEQNTSGNKYVDDK